MAPDTKHNPIDDTQRAALLEELGVKREKLREFRFGTQGSRTKNVKEAREARKEIARILTKLNRR